MIYITGDTHRDFNRLNSLECNENDMIIVLGDAGINYFLNEEDKKFKEYLKRFKLKIFCIRGNHEERPENISTYKEVKMFNGKVYIEKDYPNLIFAKDGEVYDINNQKVLVIGGAYSIDKEYRLLYGERWFKDEQLTEQEKENILNKYKGQHINIILSHTAPLKYEPEESFKLSLNQINVDKSMEKFLDKLEELVYYDKWYCGHYHIEKKIDKIEFVFGRIKEFNTDNFMPKFDSKYGYEILRDIVSKDKVFTSDGGAICPFCKSNNIIIQKGNGENINGDDAIALICNKCKKVYGFNDVKYKHNCPKEI